MTDRNTADHEQTVAQSLHAAGWVTSIIVLEPGEGSKSLEVMALLYDRLVDLKADRQTLVVAVGGGVIGDLAGFVAATYQPRPAAAAWCPTTLLAMVDSSVGGKVGVNHPRAKNLIGAFHQPRRRLDRHRRAGDAARSRIPQRPGRGRQVRRHPRRGVLRLPRRRTPTAILGREPDGGAARRRPLLPAQGRRRRAGRARGDRPAGRPELRPHVRPRLRDGRAATARWLHGEAVAAGMVCASRLAERLGRIDAAATARQVNLLRQMGLPTSLPADVSLRADDVLDRMRLDKKAASGRMRLHPADPYRTRRTGR